MYTWKPGARVRASADFVGEICEEMAMAGRLTAKNLVDDSRPEDAPLHNEFEWNDSIAAESWRKEQAQHIINHLEIRIEEKSPVQAFVKLSTTEREYKAMDFVVRDQNSREMLLRNALMELKSFKRKYDALAELAAVFSAIDKVAS